MKQQIYGLLYRRLISATRYSWLGLSACFRHEEAFRVELFIGVLTFPFAFVLAESVSQLCLLLGSSLIVLITELLNSAIEDTVDMFGSEHNELGGRAKDQGSAAVLLSMILFLLVWGTLGWQRLVA